jgi:hypothetical protein
MVKNSQRSETEVWQIGSGGEAELLNFTQSRDKACKCETFTAEFRTIL